MGLKTIPELIAASGMSRSEFAKRFSIPYRTVQNWCLEGGQHRECPVYVRLMLQEILHL